ncbi:MAG TPA: hypothetical protein VG815_12115 [Chloroflexota bacterium]|nr:hypothetical protein [Chloroflexota bacterium]
MVSLSRISLMNSIACAGLTRRAGHGRAEFGQAVSAAAPGFVFEFDEQTQAGLVMDVIPVKC